MNAHLTALAMAAALALLAPPAAAAVTSHASATLTWTWTPTRAGNYTVQFTDHALVGHSSPQTIAYTVHGNDTGNATTYGSGAVLEVSRAQAHWFLHGLSGVALVAFGAIAMPLHVRGRTRLVLTGIAAAAFLAACLLLALLYRGGT